MTQANWLKWLRTLLYLFVEEWFSVREMPVKYKVNMVRMISEVHDKPPGGFVIVSKGTGVLTISRTTKSVFSSHRHKKFKNPN